MNIILNEKEYIDKIEKEGLIDKKPSKTISLLAKYYNKKEMNKQQIADTIDDFFCKHYTAKYNKVLWGDLIESISNQAIKDNKDLIHIESVTIYEEEIEFIQNIKHNTIEKLAFTYLVYSKILNQINPNNNNWVSGKYRTDIFKDANVSETGQRQLQLIHRMMELNILKLSTNITNNSVNTGSYIKDMGNVALSITDFRELGLQYMKVIGDKKISSCKECDRLMLKKTNNHIYCSICQRQIKNEMNKKNMKKYRCGNSEI